MLSMSKTAAQFLEQPAAMKLPLGLNLIRFTALPAAQQIYSIEGWNSLGSIVNMIPQNRA